MAFGTFISNSFNTQPPEGGWALRSQGVDEIWGFNTQPPEGGWIAHIDD